MNFQDLRNDLLELLLLSFEQREANNIIAIYLEDRFGKSMSSSGNLSNEEIKQYHLDRDEFRNGSPVQYIVGKTFFFNNFFKVSPSVLIPRPETEELVARTLKSIEANKDKKEWRILDIGTGSGCIALSVKKKVGHANVIAIDISSDALRVAKENALQLNTEIEFRQIDFLDRKNWSSLGKFDLILSNPPYIAESEKGKMKGTVLDFEPDLALFPIGEDALIFYREALNFASSYLNPGGEMLLEINEFNKEELEKILPTLMPGRKYSFLRDLQGKYRILHLIC